MNEGKKERESREREERSLRECVYVKEKKKEKQRGGERELMQAMSE